MIYEYKLKFVDEQQASQELERVLDGIKPYNYSLKEIGIHQTGIDFDEETGEYANVVIHEGYHVDIRSRVQLGFKKEHIVIPKSPIHSFS